MNHYRRQRPGPERELQETFLSDVSGVLDNAKRWWLASSLPLGAGLPDIVAVHYNDFLGPVNELKHESVEVLAYLRAVRQARPLTVAHRLGLANEVAASALRALGSIGAIQEEEGLVRLTSDWRQPLPEVVAIEFKMSDWRRGLWQATRNLVFSHRSFVALPVEVAARVRFAPEFAPQGIGVISVPVEGAATIARRSRSSPPRSWRYYYQLASRVVASGGGRAL